MGPSRTQLNGRGLEVLTCKDDQVVVHWTLHHFLDFLRELSDALVSVCLSNMSEKSVKHVSYHFNLLPCMQVVIYWTNSLVGCRLLLILSYLLTNHTLDIRDTSSKVSNLSLLGKKLIWCVRWEIRLIVGCRLIWDGVDLRRQIWFTRFPVFDMWNRGLKWLWLYNMRVHWWHWRYTWIDTWSRATQWHLRN